ncbi:VOC family protein [Streptomyces sp. NPDC127097]|uniref:VOC family protein n=1 Tax=Streptomyces sp. NPDC127097 TaxID=3347136 RepID=UPI00365BA7A4
MWYPERHPVRVRGRRPGRRSGVAGSSHSPGHATDSLTRSLHPGQEEPPERGCRPLPKRDTRRSEPHGRDGVDDRVARLVVARHDALYGWGALLAIRAGAPSGPSRRCRRVCVGISLTPRTLSRALTSDQHGRCRPGLHHIAFRVETRDMVDSLVEQATSRGGKLLFPDLHQHAAGERSYAAYLENEDGFEVELVAAEQA